MNDYNIPEDVRQSVFELGQAPHCGRERQIKLMLLVHSLGNGF